jgi:hypothetical protein
MRKRELKAKFLCATFEPRKTFLLARLDFGKSVGVEGAEKFARVRSVKPPKNVKLNYRKI